MVCCSLNSRTSFCRSLFLDRRKKDSSMSLALLENNTSSLSGNEIVLIESQEKMQLKDESSITYDVDGKSNAEEHVVKKETAGDRKEKKKK